MRLPVHVWIREANADPGEIAGYFRELAARLDGYPQKMRLTVESSVPVSLDFDPKDGNPVVAAGGGARKFDIRRRWLPEHPVPLEFGRRPTVLLIDPIDGNRFRVRSSRRISVPGWVCALLAVAATVAAITLHPAAIALSAAMAAVLTLPSKWCILRARLRLGRK